MLVSRSVYLSYLGLSISCSHFPSFPSRLLFFPGILFSVPAFLFSVPDVIFCSLLRYRFVLFPLRFRVFSRSLLKQQCCCFKGLHWVFLHLVFSLCSPCIRCFFFCICLFLRGLSVSLGVLAFVVSFFPTCQVRVVRF